MNRIVFEIVHKPYKVDTGFMGLEAEFSGSTYVLAPTPELAALAFHTMHPGVEILRTVQYMTIAIEARITAGD